ncbi:SDR family NAD(P)-dependent oxidoreductase [Deinococcus sp.]|uniref:SDR family NAD(P)-dependent oxidoreductase n=1 Tax=Deinococcus sp. TaxID=47478 RepID=UPI003C7D8E20
MTNGSTGKLQGQTALITGATSGIGRGIAMALAAEGAHVVVSGRDASRGDETVQAIRAAGGQADFVRADLGASSPAARTLAAEATAILGGHIDILVNNAGVYPVGPTAAVTDETLDAMLDVNIRAPHVLVAAIAPKMAGRGHGCIINIGSWMGSLGIGFSALYGASKVALEQMSRSWAAEYGPSGVRVNAIAPGVILTEGNEDSKAAIEQMVASTPAGRVGTPADIARAVVFLASDEASFIHAATLSVDGGILHTMR